MVFGLSVAMNEEDWIYRHDRHDRHGGAAGVVEDHESGIVMRCVEADI